MSLQVPKPTQSELLARCWASVWDAILAVDGATGLVMDSNSGAEHLTGYSHDELIGLTEDSLHPESEREALRRALAQEPGQPATLKGFHILRKDGGRLPLEISRSEIFEAEGLRLMTLRFRDTTEQVQIEHRLSVQNWALSAYSNAALALGRAQAPNEVMQSVCEAITRDSPYVLAWIGLAEDAPGRPVSIAAWAGPASDYLEGLEISWDQDQPSGRGPTGTSIRTGAPQIMQDSETSPEFTPWVEKARKAGIRSSASVQIRIHGHRLGALMVYATRPHAFEAEAVEVFQNLANEVARALRDLDHERELGSERHARERAQAGLAQALIATIQALAATVEKRDPYTAGHQERVSKIACAIGGELGWGEDRLQGLQLAGLVHDIGKVAIPIEILTKPARLTPIERAMVNEHPENGYAILKDIPFPWPVADIVRQHHERLDGTGYPLGLAGDAILLEARVLAVADILESMASFRPYRAALGLEVALKEIEQLSGPWLDPAVVAACTTLFREKQFPLPVPNRH
ncbi:MAG TPA: HD domain-containing phosphohydrolase [Holophagaceae bacterium]|nr:HD domain-containing phosphohydrolase [Holophagaceae bacterium]